jgi:protease secretion system membrane fusion protein
MALPNLFKSSHASVQDAQVVLTEDSSGPRASADTRSVARTGLWVLGIGFGGFLLWAALAPLDEGVPTQGMVTLDTKRKAVQHLSGGIVKEVLVQLYAYAGFPRSLNALSELKQSRNCDRTWPLACE